jgi:hypothetical protein
LGGGGRADLSEDPLEAELWEDFDEELDEESEPELDFDPESDEEEELLFAGGMASCETTGPLCQTLGELQYFQMSITRPP